MDAYARVETRTSTGRNRYKGNAYKVVGVCGGSGRGGL